MKAGEFTWEIRRSFDGTASSRARRTFQYGAKSVVFWGRLRPDIHSYILVYFISSFKRFLHGVLWLYSVSDSYTNI